MLRAGITLTKNDIGILVAPDKQADVYIMPISELHGDGQGSSSTEKHFRDVYDNGTRVYSQYAHNGTPLKYFQVNDEPEKRVTIIIKE